MTHKRAPARLPARYLVASAWIALLSLAACHTDRSTQYGSAEMPHQLDIVAEEEGCPTDVRARDQSPCTSEGVEGLCVQPGDWLVWSAEDAEGFRIRFERERTPLRRDCEMATSQDPLRCQVAEDAADGVYKYSVFLLGCEEELDPRIIVRRVR